VCLQKADPLLLGPTGLPVLPARDVAVGRSGGLHGAAPGAGARRARSGARLWDALRPPCVVTFSSGRDSSLLLAVAAEVAACEGLEPPIALTILLAQHARGGCLVTGNAATRYPVALRAAWLADVPPASTAMVLQQSRLVSRTEAP